MKEARYLRPLAHVTNISVLIDGFQIQKPGYGITSPERRTHR